MKYDFVDIGTSDFDTSLDLMKKDQKVLLVEPIKYYLDRLPSGKGIQKLNVAVSNTMGDRPIFYVPDEVIKQYFLPDWIRGCNSINHEHLTVLKMFKQFKISTDLIRKELVSIVTFDYLVEIYKITSIGLLKIDTEGHDHIILEGVLKCMGNGLKIKQIKIEYDPAFKNTQELDQLIQNSTYTKATLEGNNAIIDF